MPLNLASPGIVVKEIDLTLGRVSPSSNKVGAIVAPFAKGPVDSPTLVENENDLLINFGEPYATDKHYEHWLTASSYLAYGGSLRVVRSDDQELKNGFVPTTVGAAASVKIKSLDHYESLQYDENTLTGVVVAARNPGSWSNGLRVAIIDGKADQTLTGINTSEVATFTVQTTKTPNLGVTTDRVTGITTTGISVGQVIRTPAISGIFPENTTVLERGVSTIVFSNTSLNVDQLTLNIQFGISSTTSAPLQIGYGVEQSVAGRVNPGIGTTAILNGYLKGIITGVGASTIDVKVLSHVSAAGTETQVDYQPSGVWAFSSSGTVGIHTNDQAVAYGTTTYSASRDWFDQQTIGLTTSSSINWNTVAQVRNVAFDNWPGDLFVQVGSGQAFPPRWPIDQH